MTTIPSSAWRNWAIPLVLVSVSLTSSLGFVFGFGPRQHQPGRCWTRPPFARPPVAVSSCFVAPSYAKITVRTTIDGTKSQRMHSVVQYLAPLCLSNDADDQFDPTNGNSGDAVNDAEDDDDGVPPEDNGQQQSQQQRIRIRQRVSDLARKMVMGPISYAAPMPQAIASVLKDATLGALDMAVEEVLGRRHSKDNDKTTSNAGKRQNVAGRSSKGTRTATEVTTKNISLLSTLDVTTLIEEAFLPVEQSLEDMERSLKLARQSLEEAKLQAIDAMGAVQAAAIAQAEGALSAVAAVAEENEAIMADLYAASTMVRDDSDLDSLTLDDVQWKSSEMAPPFLDENQCLVPGEPIVRVEKAPENSRRIFAGVDIMASADVVWKVLTDYANLQAVVPNLVVNEVLELYPGSPNLDQIKIDTTQPEEVQCQQFSQCMKGAKLRQVGGAKVAGLQFSARTTLEVREWPKGLPDFAHFNEELWQGKSRSERAKEYSRMKLQRYRFPRPFAVSSLPTRDISMQSVPDDTGEFRLYQGVWRMQPLPGCAPPGQQAMRLTYAVEVSPRAYLPVQLVEGRIVSDLCTNLEAIRDYVSSPAFTASVTGTTSSTATKGKAA